MDGCGTPCTKHWHMWCCRLGSHLHRTTSWGWSSVRARTADLTYAHAYHLLFPCTVFCRCDGIMNVLTVVMLSCKCHIQIMVRKMTSKGITMLCQYIIIIIVRLLYHQINNVDMLLRYMSWLSVWLWMNTLIVLMGPLCAIVRIFKSVCKSTIASVVMTTTRSFDTLHGWKLNILSKYLLNRLLLKLNFRQYPAIHTNYSLSNCTNSN